MLEERKVRLDQCCSVSTSVASGDSQCADHVLDILFGLEGDGIPDAKVCTQ